MKRLLLALLVVWLVGGCTPQTRAPIDGAAAAYKAAVAGRWSDIWYIVGRHTWSDITMIKGGADG